VVFLDQINAENRSSAQETLPVSVCPAGSNSLIANAEMNIAELREAIRSVFRGKPVSRVDLFGSAARGEMRPESDVDILVTPKPEATRRDLFIMAADVEDAVGRRVDFLIRADVEAMKSREAKDLILKGAVPIYVA
jgi:predicted nucleotidyltransferase